MRYLYLCFLLICITSICTCKEASKKEIAFTPRNITKVDIETLIEDATLNVRAIEIKDTNILYGSSNSFGIRDLSSSFKFNIKKLKGHMHKDNLRSYIINVADTLNFRSVASNTNNMFVISIANPAKLYKIPFSTRKSELVYQENHDKVFYDAMDFWNDQEGIAIGDSVNGCLSIIITRDGGTTWSKLLCKNLPNGIENEGAFAASDTNIAIVGDKTWVATTTGRVFYSSDKGNTWNATNTPIIKDKDTEGIYSIAFYDEKNGFAIGGDYTKPDDNAANKIRTKDGGKTWQLAAINSGPGYRSCVQYIPGRNAKEMIAIGFKGIDYSKDSGSTWTHLSDEGFYTIRFLNDSTAYAAGNKRISKLTFK